MREEPSVGAIDMGDVELRRPRPRIERAEEDQYAGLWWRIALGIFVGMLAHSIVTGLYVRWEIYKGLRAVGIEIDKFENGMKDARGAPPPSAARPATPSRAQRPSIRPLAAGERCVGGKRFRQVTNGWVQVDETCR